MLTLPVACQGEPPSCTCCLFKSGSIHLFKNYRPRYLTTMIQNFIEGYESVINVCYSLGILLLTSALVMVPYWTYRNFRQKDRNYKESCRQEDRDHKESCRQVDRDHKESCRQQKLLDQEISKQADRLYQTDCKQKKRTEDRNLEWRRFAKEIFKKYTGSQDILEKLSKVKNTAECMPIHSEVTGLDVLRYMLSNANYRNFESKSPELRALRKNYFGIFSLLEYCSASLPSGIAPENIMKYLRELVEELWKVVEPFLASEQQRIALKCRERFGSNRASNTATEHDTRRESEVDVKSIIPYVDSLQFGGSDAKMFLIYLPGVDKALEDCNDNERKNIQFLRKLNNYLQLETQSATFFSEHQAEQPVGSVERIRHHDSNEVILMKVRHEVRLYIHLILSQSRNISENEQVKRNINSLREIYVNNMASKPMEDQIKEVSCHVCRKLKKTTKKDLPEYLIDPDYLKMLTDLDEFLPGLSSEENLCSETADTPV